MWKRLALICVSLSSEVGVGLAMAHGAPDFAQYRRDSVTYPVLDLAELAARLGSINTYDRRGDTVWMDDFEDNIAKWLAVLGGTGAAVALSTSAARNGAKSAKLTTGSAAGNTTRILRILPLPRGVLVGVEFSFSGTMDARYITLQIYLDDGAFSYRAYTRYSGPDQTLEIQQADGAWVTLASNVIVATATHGFNTLKLVADWSTQQYVRLILNDTEYDISAYGLYPAESEDPGLMAVDIGVQTDIAANTSIYVDDVIVTQNEP